jgi:hypothetical protein
MSLSDLLSKGLVEKFQSDQDQIKKEMDIAKNDLVFKKYAYNTGMGMGA